MANGYFGVDCASPFPPIAAQISAVVGAYPSVVGRYLLDIPGISTSLSPSEAISIHGQGSKILPIFNGANESTPWTYVQGQQHGLEARTLAKALGVPAGTFIPVDIESSFPVTDEYLAGYIDSMPVEHYIGGAYLPVTSNLHYNAWVEARRLTTSPAYLYTSTPEYFSWAGTIRSTWFDFTSIGIPAAIAAEIAVMQYSENEINGLVDYDVCTTYTYQNLLWGPDVPKPAPVEQRMKVIKKCGLNPKPAHGGKSVATIPAGGQILDSGTRNGDWSYVEWDGFWGWILTANSVAL